MNYFPKIKVAEFLCEATELSKGEDVIITGPTTGILQTKVNEIRVDLKEVQTVKKGERFSIPVNEMVRRSDKLYKIVTSSNAAIPDDSSSMGHFID